MSTASPPLASLVVISYRQENFIEDALQAALAQDFPSIEIVFSDDASPDGTWAKALGFLERHPDGARVITRRAAVNTGICGNIEEAVKLTSGKYIIIAAGDDISLPQRVTATVALFESNPQIFACGSDFEAMDMAGNPLGFMPGSVNRQACDARSLAALGQNIGGAGAAYRREVFERFGPIDRKTLNEDMVLEFRAALLGLVAPLPQPLVRHRIHGDSATGSASGHVSNSVQYEAGARKMAQSILRGYESRLVDLGTAEKAGLPQAEAEEIRASVKRHIAIFRNIVDLHDKKPMAYLRWLLRVLVGRVPLQSGLRSLVMAGFPRLWFWYISRPSRHGQQGP